MSEIMQSWHSEVAQRSSYVPLSIGIIQSMLTAHLS